MTSRTIMVVDDELPIQRVLSRMLNGPSRTVIAADGMKAMAMAVECRPEPGTRSQHKAVLARFEPTPEK